MYPSLSAQELGQDPTVVVTHVMDKMRTQNKPGKRAAVFPGGAWLSSVSPTHMGSLSWPHLFISCDGSIQNIHNKDIFPFGKIQSQEHSRLPALCQAPLGLPGTRGKQDVGCSQLTNELQRGNKCSRDLPVPITSVHAPERPPL